MATLEDFELALRVKEVLTKLVSDMIDAKRPPYRYATVQTIDRVNRVCSVQFVGETGTLNATISTVQPGFVGQRVRVEGRPGDYYISATVDASSGAYINYLFLNKWSSTQGAAFFLEAQDGKNDFGIYANGDWLDFYDATGGTGHMLWLRQKLNNPAGGVVFVDGSLNIKNDGNRGCNRHGRSKSSSQTVGSSSAAWTDVTFDTSLYQTESDGVTMPFGDNIWIQVPVPGPCTMTCTLHTTAWGAAAGYASLRIINNSGVVLAQSPPFMGSSFAQPVLMVEKTAHLAATQYVKVQITQSSGSNFDIVADNANLNGGGDASTKGRSYFEVISLRG